MNGRDQRGGQRRGGHGGRNRQNDSYNIGDETIDQILANNGQIIADEAKRLADSLGRRLSSAQIRNFYGAMIKYKAAHKDPQNTLNKLHFMRPRLAYMAARQNEATPLKDSFDRLIQTAKPTKTHLDGIFNFAEAVVAYHKQHSK